MNMVAKKTVLRPICDCSSYRFPHRAGGGACTCEYGVSRLPHSSPSIKLQQLCAACGQPAKGRDVDFGIGAYEFWGCKGVDTDVQHVSECCEAGFVDNSRREADSHPEWFNNKV